LSPALYSRAGPCEKWAVRPVFLLILLLTAASAARAQEQERKLIDRIMRPDTALQATEQTRSFYQGKSSVQDKTASTKSFYSPNHVSLKEYNTRSFYDGHGYWDGSFKYETKEANTKPRFLGIFPLLKRYDTKAVEVKDARESGRSYATRDYETREFRGRGTAQGSIDAEYQKNKGMSVDQVRDLLNKNK
jgi:hypothetical protein